MNEGLIDLQYKEDNITEEKFFIFIRNCENKSELKATIESVDKQNYSNYKIQIIDENEDENEFIISKYEDENQLNNIYFTVLNSGDKLSEDVLCFINNTIENKYNLIYGDEIFIQNNGKIIKKFNKDKLQYAVKYEYIMDSCFINFSDFVNTKLTIENYIKNKICFNDKILYINHSTHFKKIANQKYKKSKIKPIAFYLPQFHEIPENNMWWGEGFTEWTNVKKATALFEGHNQPRLPGEYGYYDLALDKDILHKQVDLAREYGVYGFCFYYYWFEGKRLLEKPMDRFINDKNIDFPFCICWANETWSRRWTGEEQEVLIKQVHNKKTDIDFIYDVLDLFKDDRYIKINGKPILLVYRVELFDDLASTIKVWNDICIKEGIGNIEVIVVQSFGKVDPTDYDTKYAVEFPPRFMDISKKNDFVKNLNPNFAGNIYDYKEIVRTQVEKEPKYYDVFRACMLEWDNTARRGNSGHIYHGCDGDQYQTWLENIADYTYRYNKDYEQFVFINAWNEWAEGTYLEPDEKNGTLYLEKTKKVTDLYSNKPIIDFDKKFSVVVYSHNNAQFIVEALDSVVYQTYENIELIIIDNNSNDNSVEFIRSYLERDYVNKRLKNINFIKINETSEVFNVINNAIIIAKGDYITVVTAENKIDYDYCEKAVSAMNISDTEIGFTSIEIINVNGMKIKDSEKDKIYYTQENIIKCDSLVSAVFENKKLVQYGNIVFTRKLYNQVNGFSEFKCLYNLDFFLRCSKVTKPIRIVDSKFLYRQSSSNVRECDTKLVESEKIELEYLKR